MSMVSFLTLNLFYRVTTLAFKVDQIHLALTDEDNSMVITWAISDEVGSISVRYNEASSSSPISFPHSSKASCWKFNTEDKDNDSRLPRFCSVELENLKMNTTYYYQIGSSKLGWTDSYTFRSKRSGKEANVIVYGDFGGDQVVDSITATEKLIKKEIFDAIIHAGDIAYNLDTKDGTNGDKFLNDIEPISSFLPYMISQGSHEIANNQKYFENRFSMPGKANGL